MEDVQTYLNFETVDDVSELPDVATKVSLAIQSQYAHASDFINLGDIAQRKIDATSQLEAFLIAIASPETSRGVFLDWWGKRVGVERFIKVKNDYYRFDDDYYRFLIFYRALCNISCATADVSNRLLQRLVNSTVFVVDYLNMSINSIVIIGNISDLQGSILQTYGLLNRPAGVLTNLLVIYPDEQIFGFEGSKLLPFDVGVFNPGRTIDIN